MNFHTMLLVADQFYNAYQLLDANETAVAAEIAAGYQDPAPSPEFLDKVEQGGFKQTGLPAITCMAFCTELYLKTLHFAVAGEQLRGHDTRKLFDQLHATPRKALIDLLLRNGGGDSEAIVLQRLTFNSDAFVEFRYFHERKEASFMLTFGVTVVLFLRKLLAPYRLVAQQRLAPSANFDEQPRVLDR